MRDFMDAFSRVVTTLTSLEVGVHVLLFLIFAALIIIGAIEGVDKWKRRRR